MSEIPAGWVQRALVDITVNITDGKHGDCQNKSDSEYYFISAKDIINGEISYENARQITEEDFLDTHRRTKFEIDDIVLTNSGTIGKIAIARNKSKTSRTTFQKSVAVIKPDSKMIHPYYLSQALMYLQPRLDILASGSSQKNLLLRDIRSLKIPYPPIEEQRAIADILGTWDEAIALTESLISALEVRKKGLMQKLLTGELRFSEFDGEWEEVKLIEITKNGVFTDGDWVESKDQDPNGDVRLIQLADIGDGFFVDKSSRYMTSEKVEILNGTYLQENDILVARMPEPIGRATLFPEIDMPSVTVVDVCIIRPNDNVNKLWLMYKINSSWFRHQITRRATGTTRTRISRKNLGEISLQLPNLDEQEYISEILSIFDDGITFYENYVTLLQQQKKGLMQQLLTGQVRVRV